MQGIIPNKRKNILKGVCISKRLVVYHIKKDSREKGAKIMRLRLLFIVAVLLAVLCGQRQ